jgi:hypothetical protein
MGVNVRLEAAIAVLRMNFLRFTNWSGQSWLMFPVSFLSKTTVEFPFDFLPSRQGCKLFFQFAPELMPVQYHKSRSSSCGVWWCLKMTIDSPDHPKSRG